MAGDDEREAWRQGRRHAAAEHAAALARRRRTESDQAAALLARFVEEARARGLTTSRLRARPYSGGGTYPTDVEGWYLRKDGSLGVDTQGRFYVLTVPTRRLGRWRTLQVAPEDPPLVVGAGARDGESIALDALLDLRLQAGDDWRR